ncbi:bifunctional 2-C-methyl-D-erythritol 4-phosphate cytidylyltransferase/2-C-methyl-D-erythritol 2,4-cyclodiphosphate synthase [Microbaculum marinisediminis]|uniref:Bifunctional enzyme IspD/IspF n=1 Tax=Microbaculum marinisediminis TaxID=2931392 RepID=A0AAW5R2V3_9HYPH|nr:bifunctional 2-C-methyl-D-erythritol 4-phosphate cytidylyltransferase/2-C-methyl-D-erythritol 2,4-cyclodiphosphate synthase [Microbaculum sp. A6E488]MCT8974169.1 bifunctional 2-C-methyl-D-erythritol 4-phosphate cytidylyltransferase/2-C-methyl-D-erythritol 2,4-cyclodiphosphate synthase [Microbaculum sp. A6E488]
MTTIAVIVAGGTGTRASVGDGPEPKQFRLIGGRSVVARAVAALLDHPRVDAVQVVVREGWQDRLATEISDRDGLLPAVPGGATRQASVRAGLEAIAGHAPDRVLIHDAARPFVSSAVIDRVLDGLDGPPGAIPALPVADTLKRAESKGTISATVDRDGLFAAQTPQGFRFPEILKAHRRAATIDRDFTDDAAIAEWAGIPVTLVAGDPANRKLTTPEDFAMAEALLGIARETRVGTGYDVHRFAEGDFVTLCGIEIAHDRGLLGHSDADVGLHALTDAILGAIADGDIGNHFPPSDPQWKAAASDIFLSHAAGLIAARGGTIVHADVTLICETPKIGPHRDAMRARIADILAIAIERVSVKATTSEGLGFTGRREGIAAQAVATVSLPAEGT